VNTFPVTLNKRTPILNYKIILLITIFSFGCVYFNTFYNAEQSFDKAVRLIDEAPDEDELPSQAKNLLREAITNSEIVIQKYPESKYVDDAFFIMGKSSFFLGDISAADKYLNRLIYEFPNSPFKEECEIWLTYAQYKKGYADSSLININHLLHNPPKSKNLKYLLYNIVGDVELSRDSILTAFTHYETAARLADNNSKRMNLYNKMIAISEQQKDYQTAVNLLEQLELYATTSQMKQGAILKWIEYNRNLGNYDIVITKIDELLLDPEYSIHHLSLQVEKAKIYQAQKDYSRATDLFKEILEDPKNARKDPTSEAAYHLGNLALVDGFDPQISIMYMDSVTQIFRNSTYRNKAAKLKAKAIQYQTLEADLRSATNSKSEGIMIEPENLYPIDSLAVVIPDSNKLLSMDPGISGLPMTSVFLPDSLLFTMAEMLLFEFNRTEMSIEKYSELISDFPDSKYVPQSMYVLARFLPEERVKWEAELLEKFPDSVFTKAIEGDTPALEKPGNILENLRDIAWLDISTSPAKAVERFDKIAAEYDDPVSAYNSAYIYDKYLYVIKTTIQRYQTFLEKYPDHELSKNAKGRLEEITEAVQSLRTESIGWVDRLTSIVNIFAKADTLHISSEYGENLFSAIHDSVTTASSLDTLNIHFDGDSMWIITPLDTTTVPEIIASVYIHSTSDSLTLKSDSTPLLTGQKGKFIRIINPPNLLDLYPHSDSIRYRFYEKGVVPHHELDSVIVLLGLDEVVVTDSSIPEPLFVAEIDSLSKTIQQLDVPIKGGNEFTSQISGLIEKPMDLITNSEQQDGLEHTIPSKKPELKPEPVSVYPETDEKLKPDHIFLDLPADKNIPDLNSEKGYNSTSRGIEYIVKPGENLYSIAQDKYHDQAKWRDIYNTNTDVIGEDPNKIYPYHTIYLDDLEKTGSTFVTITLMVQQGESLWSIAEKVYGDPLAWSILLEDNQAILAENGNLIMPGTIIKIRSKL